MQKPFEEPTLDSIWQTVAGSSITQDLLDWPPDLFALSEVLLERSEAYRFALSPPSAESWPPRASPCWSTEVVHAARQWCAWIDGSQPALPELLMENWRALGLHLDAGIEAIASGKNWGACTALLTLHAIADEACAGLGVALDCSDGFGCIYRARGRELLARTGSMARMQPERLRVLPKVRTPPRGTSLRSLSRYACISGKSVSVRWHKLPARRPGTAIQTRHANLLLLPWPLRIRESDFRPIEGSIQLRDKESFGLFEFAPQDTLQLDFLRRIIRNAREEVDSVDVVVMPEGALDADEVAGVEQLIEGMGVTMLIAGVRQGSPEPGSLPGNWVHIGVSPGLEKGGRSSPNAGAEEWFHIRQNKHHRWSLDERQIHQYHLGGALHPKVRWWEKTEIPRRQLHFVELGDEVTLVSLVCEDLAQIDDVAEIIRSVGPTLVITPVMDGPQLASRWAARYASVLADDPGCSVLTLSSLGMVQRSRPAGKPAVPIVAMWKDPVRGVREIPLEPGAHGVLLTVCSDLATRRTTDGRAAIDNTTHCFDVAVHQVRSAGAVTNDKLRAEEPVCHTLDVCDLSILTGWAEAIAEAATVSPQLLQQVVNAASADSAWRSSMGLGEPSPPLAKALGYVAEIICLAVPSRTGESSVDLLQHWQLHPESGIGVKSLTNRVMRSALEQFQTRRITHFPARALQTA